MSKSLDWLDNWLGPKPTVKGVSRLLLLVLVAASFLTAVIFSGFKWPFLGVRVAAIGIFVWVWWTLSGTTNDSH